MNRSGSGFAYFTSSRVTTTAFAGSTPERLQIDRRGFHPAARRDRPWRAGLRQRVEQFARARQRAHLRAQPLIRLSVQRDAAARRARR